MGPQRIVPLLLVASCNAEPVADVGELSAADSTEPGTSSGTTTASATTSEASGDPSDDEGSTTGSVDDDSEGDGPLLDVGSDDGPLGCVAAAEQYIYLLALAGPASMQSQLHRYDPETGEVESLGPLACPGASVPMALTIDRSGLLWANLVTEEGYRRIYTVDPETLECLDTGYVDPEGYSSGGLAFVADAPDSEEETLYIGMQEGSIGAEVPMELATIDLATMEPEIIGELPIVGSSYQVADMIGTGDARMFAFFISGPTVLEIDETAPEIVDEHTLPFVVGSPWAFAQWGSRFYLFTNADGGSRVRAFDPATGDVEEIAESIGVSVVGAAVSTCAPYKPEG